MKPAMASRARTTLGTRFPRQTRRGLIEAARRAYAAPRTAPHFPGRHAGASLKRGRALGRVQPAHAHFPGRHAGASLKRS